MASLSLLLSVLTSFPVITPWLKDVVQNSFYLCLGTIVVVGRYVKVTENEKLRYLSLTAVLIRVYTFIKDIYCRAFRNAGKLYLLQILMRRILWKAVSFLHVHWILSRRNGRDPKHKHEGFFLNRALEREWDKEENRLSI